MIGLTKTELEETISNRQQYEIIEKDTKTEDIEKMLEFIESINLSDEEVRKLCISKSLMNDIIKSARKYIKEYGGKNNEVTTIIEYKEYRIQIERMMTLISNIIPSGFCVSDIGNKIVIENVYRSIK